MPMLAIKIKKNMRIFFLAFLARKRPKSLSKTEKKIKPTYNLLRYILMKERRVYTSDLLPLRNDLKVNCKTEMN